MHSHCAKGIQALQRICSQQPTAMNGPTKLQNKACLKKKNADQIGIFLARDQSEILDKSLVSFKASASCNGPKRQPMHTCTKCCCRSHFDPNHRSLWMNRCTYRSSCTEHPNECFELVSKMPQSSHQWYRAYL